MSLNDNRAVSQIRPEEAGNNEYVLSLLDSGYRWTDNDINFSFNGWATGSNKDQHTRQMMADALRSWAEVANITFTSKSSTKSGQNAADILFEQSMNTSIDGSGRKFALFRG
jgi:hypothetical protein